MKKYVTPRFCLENVRKLFLSAKKGLYLLPFCLFLSHPPGLGHIWHVQRYSFFWCTAIYSKKRWKYGPLPKNDTMSHPPCSVWHWNSMIHPKMVAAPATLFRFWFRKQAQICETILVKIIEFRQRLFALVPILITYFENDANWAKLVRYQFWIENWNHKKFLLNC